MDSLRVIAKEIKKPRFFYGYTIVALAFFFLLLMSGSLYSYGVFFKPLAAEFGWTRAVTSGAYSLGLFVSGIVGMAVGGLNDRFGSRLILTGGGFFFGLGYILMSLTNNTWHLYVFYGIILGTGMGAIFVPILSTIAKWFARRRGLMTGIVFSGVGAGTIIMPLVSNRLLYTYGWRNSFLVLGAILMVVLIVLAQFFRRDPAQMGQSPDGENGAAPENLGPEIKVFSLQEAVRTKQFWMISVMFLAYGFGFQSIMVHIVPHATDLQISLLVAAGIVSMIGGGGIAGRLAIGVVSDKIGNRLSFIISFSLLTIAILWLIAAKEPWMLYLFALVFGISYGSLSVLMSPAVAELFGLRAHGAILGAAIFIMEFGEATGPLLAGRIFDMTGSYVLAFLLYAILSILGLVLSSLLRPPRRQGLT